MNVAEVISGIGRPIAFYPKLARVVGGIHECLFLCQLIYWTGKGSEQDGWIWKSRKEIEEETTLTRHEQDTVRKQLVEALGVVEAHYDRLNHRLLFRVNSGRLDELFKTSFPSESRIPAIPNAGNLPSESRIPVIPPPSASPSESRKPAMARPESGYAIAGKRSSQGRKPPVDNISAKNTTQITPETTTTTRPEASEAKGRTRVAAAPSSFPSVGGIGEGPTGVLSAQDQLELDAIALEFDSDGRQKAKADACAKRRGMAFVREQADIVRLQKTRLRNLAGAFEKACDSPEGWKRPKPTASKKPARKVEPNPKPEQPEAPTSEPITAEQQQAIESARRALIESLRNPSKSPEAQAKTSAAEARYELMERRWAEASVEERTRWISQGDPIIRKYFRAEGPLPMRSLWSAIIPDTDGKTEQPSQEAAA